MFRGFFLIGERPVQVLGVISVSEFCRSGGRNFVFNTLKYNYFYTP